MEDIKPTGEEQDQMARAMLVQNLLIAIGMMAAAEMSSNGREILDQIMRQLMGYLLAPREAKVQPIYNTSPMFG